MAEDNITNLESLSIDDQIKYLESQQNIIERVKKQKEARDDLISFAQYTTSGENPDDITDSRYKPVNFHREIAKYLTRLAKREALKIIDGKRLKYKRIIISIPPQHGKSTIAQDNFIPFFWGLNPRTNILSAGYNEKLAAKVGQRLLTKVQSDRYKQIFPDIGLSSNGKGKLEMVNTVGGSISMLGVGGSGTGFPADLFVIDDPVKNIEEARSKDRQDSIWDWYKSVAETRQHKDSIELIILTRWAEFDLAGRIMADPKMAAETLNLVYPALDENDHCLWPERFGDELMLHRRDTTPSDIWQALYQQNPTPADGDFFSRDKIFTYGQSELPKMSELALYTFSDHAIGLKKRNDFNVFLTVGVDSKGVIWVLPDLVWEKMKSDDQVEKMIGIMKRYPLRYWGAEKGHITKALGPFLKRRMRQEGVYTTIEELTPSKDKVTRATAIQGLMQMGMVRFPKFAPWWSKAENELLKFPNGTHDDFVDALAWSGLVLHDRSGVIGKKIDLKEDDIPKMGQITWGALNAILKRGKKKRNPLK
ncbi:MAG: phage terminase large subunit [Proteobacteria bacterium]|nr:phage terminase large subunit [Pseudomonadota bacterium]